MGVFDNEPLEAGVTQLHEMHSLECNWVKPVGSVSLSNTITTYVLMFNAHGEFDCVSCVLFNWWIW